MLTAFWSFNMPKLINADKPFIDLSGSVGESIGNASAAYEKAQPTIAPDEDLLPTVTPEPTDIPGIDEITSVEVVIKVGDERLSGSGEKISIDGNIVESVEALISLISGKDYEGNTFVLLDYFAETECYSAVIRAFEESGKPYRLDYVMY